MKAHVRLVANSLVAGLLVGSAREATTSQAGNAAIQAIQQATDPSAAVAAYANGFALDRNNPKLYEAYVNRMVEVGLPEMAYHQAQTLTTLDTNNGLAWGVVAYVDARRADMPAAISAINLAGQFAPENKFVAHTVGEIVAWYDFKSDKTKIPENAKSGLDRVRTLMAKQPMFTEAYDTAKNAYQTNVTAESTPQAGQTPAAPDPAVPAPQAPPGQQAPAAPQAQAEAAPPVYAPLTPPAAYYDWGPSYFYADWGPRWVAPVPLCWWWPIGFWGGCSFFPFHSFAVFVDFDDFHHRHFHDFDFDHDRDFGHGRRFDHDGHFGSGMTAWHHAAKSGTTFFGTPARPGPSVTQWAHAGSQPRSPSAAGAAAAGTQSWVASGHPTAGSTASLGMSGLGPRSSNLSRSTPGGTSYQAQGSVGARSGSPSAGASGMPRPMAAPRGNWPMQSNQGYRSSASAVQRLVTPSRNYYGGYGPSWRGGLPMAPRFSGGPSFGGGYHRGSFSGNWAAGGFHGGGSHGGHR